MLIAGKWRWVNFRGAVSAMDTQGRPTRVSGTLLDETDRKLAEEQAQAQKELLLTVLEHIPHAVFWKDDQGRYIGCNGRYAQSLGLSSVNEVAGKFDRELRLSTTEANLIAAADQDIVSSGREVIAQQQCVRHHDGSKRDLVISKVPLRDARWAKSSACSVSSMTLPSKRRMEKQLSDARQLESLGRLAAAWRMRSYSHAVHQR